jgi:hypothetical protein
MSEQLIAKAHCGCRVVQIGDDPDNIVIKPCTAHDPRQKAKSLVSQKSAGDERSKEAKEEA